MADANPASASTPASASASAPIAPRPLSWAAPLRWLRLGWRDFVRAPGITLFYGACFMGVG